MEQRLLQFLICALVFILLVQPVAAEDKLKPLLDHFYDAVKQFVGKIQEIIYGFFPGLEESIDDIKEALLSSPVLEWFPVIKDFFWLFYVAAFFVIMAILARLWSMSKHYLINSVVGIIALLILIHVLDVGIKVTVLKLILIAIFGVPAVIFILIAHYWGILL